MLSNAVIQVTYSTRYYYQVSDANGVCTGPVYNFTSPPRAPPPVPHAVSFRAPVRRMIRLHECRNAAQPFDIWCVTRACMIYSMAHAPLPKRIMPDACARAAAPATFPQRVLVIADLGMSYNSSTTMQHVYVRASRLTAWVTLC